MKPTSVAESSSSSDCGVSGASRDGDGDDDDGGGGGGGGDNNDKRKNATTTTGTSPSSSAIQSQVQRGQQDERMLVRQRPARLIACGGGTEKRPRRLRRGLLGVSSLYTFLFVGALFGWGPMQLLLEQDGAFHWKCASDVDDGTTGDFENSNNGDNATTTTTTATSTDNTNVVANVCPEQTSALLNVNFYATVTQVVSPAIGWAADRFGPNRVAYYMVGCTWAGLIMILAGCSGRHNNVYSDRWLYPAFGFLAQATWSGVSAACLHDESLVTLPGSHYAIYVPLSLRKISVSC